MTDHISSLITELPSSPGVYLFFNHDHEIIYIGKAVKLKARVSSYFRQSNTLDGAKRAMVAEITDLQIYPCDSEIEALILEAQLIKKYNPRYNILLKDDKSYAYLAWTKEDFPRLFVAHQTYIDTHKDQIHYLGPFINSDALRQTLRILRKIFPYRSCKTMPTRPCIYYRLNRCPAPCVGLIEKVEYKRNLDHIISFMKGHKQQVISQLKSQMNTYAQYQQFERAAEVRDQIQSLETVALHKGVIKTTRAKKSSYMQELQSVLNLDKLPKRIEGYDSSHFQGNNPVVSMVVFYNGQPQKKEYRRFKVRLPPEGGDDFYNLYQALSRRFARSDWPIPDLILIDGGKGQLSQAKKAQQEGLLQYKAIPIISLAKKQEEVYLPDQDEPILIPKHNRGLQLLQQVRDESHRFAVTYHRHLRDKETLSN